MQSILNSTTMDNFTTTCRRVDCRFDAILADRTGQEPDPIMLIRAAARMIMTRYPQDSQRDMAMADLLSSVKHLHAMDPEGSGIHG